MYQPLAERTDFEAEIGRRRLELNLGLLRIYNYFRVLLGLMLFFISSQSLFGTRLGSLDPAAFQLAAIAYTVFNLVLALAVQFFPARFFRRQLLNFTLVLVDILALSYLMFLSGGVASGLAGLILIAVAVGAIIVTGQPSTLLAASAAIALLFEEFTLSQRLPGAQDYFQAGILGILYFASSLVIQHYSNSIRRNDIRALTQAAELADLERINHLIVQRMRTGIILVNEQSQVRMANQSARALIGQVGERELREIPTPLHARLSAWRSNIGLRTPPFQIAHDTPEIRVNFQAVRSDDPTGDVTIFLEDTGEIQQQAQQLKLASLGRLSASIAHEIRNPLGAVSHAAQLLSESNELNTQDQRLTAIIYDHCQRMNAVIQNVLEMSRRNPPKPDRLRMREFLDSFINTYQQTDPDAQFEIHLNPESTEIRIDTSQMQQVLTNLADNGLRYSREATGNGKVQFEGGIEPQTDRPYLLIIDEGAGIEPEQATNLFEPFFTTESAGTGLGLYIAKELCEANQARLSYEPAPTGGSCFRINFAHPERITI